MSENNETTDARTLEERTREEMDVSSCAGVAMPKGFDVTGVEHKGCRECVRERRVCVAARALDGDGPGWIDLHGISHNCCLYCGHRWLELLVRDPERRLEAVEEWSDG